MRGRAECSTSAARGQFTVTPYQIAVPIDFVSIVDWRYEQCVRSICARSETDLQMTTVPGEARISGVPLVAPRVGSGYRLPSGIIERWRGPPWIIACMKLPETIELNLALTQSLNDKSGLRPWSGLLRMKRGPGQQRKANDDSLERSENHCAAAQRMALWKSVVNDWLPNNSG